MTQSAASLKSYVQSNATRATAAAAATATTTRTRQAQQKVLVAAEKAAALARSAAAERTLVVQLSATTPTPIFSSVKYPDAMVDARAYNRYFNMIHDAIRHDLRYNGPF